MQWNEVSPFENGGVLEAIEGDEDLIERIEAGFRMRSEAKGREKAAVAVLRLTGVDEVMLMVSNGLLMSWQVVTSWLWGGEQGRLSRSPRGY